MILFLTLPLVLCTDLFNHPVRSRTNSNIYAVSNRSNEDPRGNYRSPGIFATEVNCYMGYGGPAEFIGSTK